MNFIRLKKIPVEFIGFHGNIWNHGMSSYIDYDIDDNINYFEFYEHTLYNMEKY